jgi:hypothetical protein
VKFLKDDFSVDGVEGICNVYMWAPSNWDGCLEQSGHHEPSFHTHL